MNSSDNGPRPGVFANYTIYMMISFLIDTIVCFASIMHAQSVLSDMFFDNIKTYNGHSFWTTFIL